MKPPFSVASLGEIAKCTQNLGAMIAFYRDFLGLRVLNPNYNDIVIFDLGAGTGGLTACWRFLTGGQIHATSIRMGLRQ